jgi:glucose/arabinose dehydrogenase
VFNFAKYSLSKFEEKTMRVGHFILLFTGIASSTSAIQAEEYDLSVGTVAITAMATGLEEPWAVGFLPDGGFLVTLRGGILRRYDAMGDFVEVSGVPTVFDDGQGGLLDVLVPRDFEQSGEIFFTIAAQQGRGAGTALVRARLDGDWLRNVETIWEMERGSRGGRHFGSRIVEGRDGLLYVTVGERGDRPSAQDLTRENGSVIRVMRDGRIPADNPFVDRGGAQPEIWSYGHRNPQGAAMDGSGQLWVVEHGARGGDEVNRIIRGANYGWPVIAYGSHYTGLPIGEGTAAEGMEQPVHYWDPSIAPSGATFYEGDQFPSWSGDLFVGSLVFDYIARLDPDSGMSEVEKIATPQTGRVRDVRTAPDGSIWFLSVSNSALYRIAPR